MLAREIGAALANLTQVCSFRFTDGCSALGRRSTQLLRNSRRLTRKEPDESWGVRALGGTNSIHNHIEHNKGNAKGEKRGGLQVISDWV